MFADPHAEGVTTCETVDKDHGRLKVRRHNVCSDIDWLWSDRSHPGELRFPGLAMIGMVESKVSGRNEEKPERRYDLCSRVMPAAELARVVRAHWGVENRLHWCLDVLFDEDQCRMRSGHGPENMAVFRHIAINLLRSARSKSSLKVRRKKAAWNPAYLGDILRGQG